MTSPDFQRDSNGNVWAVRHWNCLTCGLPLAAWQVPEGRHTNCSDRNEATNAKA